MSNSDELITAGVEAQDEPCVNSFCVILLVAVFGAFAFRAIIAIVSLLMLSGCMGQGLQRLSGN